jgi:GtrA-like protein
LRYGLFGDNSPRAGCFVFGGGAFSWACLGNSYSFLFGFGGFFFGGPFMGAQNGSYPSFGRFLLVSLVSFGLNVAGMYFVTEVLLLNYLWGIIWACCLVPMITFISHNYWTFGLRS